MRTAGYCDMSDFTVQFLPIALQGLVQCVRVFLHALLQLRLSRIKTLKTVI